MNLTAGLVIALALSCTGTYFMYKGKEKAVVAFEVERSSHEITKESFSKYKNAAETAQKTSQLSLDKLNSQYIEQRKVSNELSEKLAQHDLAHLAFKKPGLVTGVFNRGTERVFQSIRNATDDGRKSTHP